MARLRARKHLSAVGERRCERTPLSKLPLERWNSNDKDVRDQLCAWQVIGDPTDDGAIAGCGSGRSDLNERCHADAPAAGLVDDLDRGRSHHRYLLNGMTICPVSIATDSTQEHIGKILLLLRVPPLIDEGNYTPHAAWFGVGVRAHEHGR